jgi:hypothetical protein
MTDIPAGLHSIPRPSPPVWPAGLELTAAALCFAQAMFLAASYFYGHWFVDANGALIATDFVGFWPAGRMILDGQVAMVYDQAAHKAAGVAALGHDFAGAYPLFYPPHYMMAMTALPLLPYLLSYVVWVALTPLPYLFVVTRIIGERIGILFALAFPALLANAMVGQNGCITAALFGGALLAMERRPVLAGILIGLLTYKPHFGILIPLALISARQWRIFASAAVTAAALVAISWLTLGGEAWVGFFNAIQSANQNTLSAGMHDWNKLQNLFGLVRVMGGSVALAWAAQGTGIAIMAALVCVVWSGRQPFAIKAAILSVGAVIASPYSYMYDLVLLAVPVAYLLRDGRDRGVLPGEMPVLGIACLLLAMFPFVYAPVGAGAALMIAGLVARRWIVAERNGLSRQVPQTSVSG